ncbi:hypothetical protein PG995_007595 [Apiospora arundinis]
MIESRLILKDTARLRSMVAVVLVISAPEALIRSKAGIKKEAKRPEDALCDGDSGSCYIILGDTLRIRAELRENGGSAGLAPI